MPIKPVDDKPITSKKLKTDATSKRWWDAPKELAAIRLYNWVANIESIPSAWDRRYANLAYFRYMTGRLATANFNYSLISRPSSVTSRYGRSQFSAPVFNAMAQCDDVLANRVYNQQTIIQVCPIAGDFSARMKAKKLTRWLDAAFYDLNIWPVIETCGVDSRMYGTGYIKVDVGLNNKPQITRICDDEVIVDETECSVMDNPRTLAIRLFLNRDEVMDRFGTTKEAIDAIQHAQSASLGLYFGNDIDVSDVIVLIEAWRLGYNDKPGRHVMSVGNYSLVDEKYKKDHFPIARLGYKALSSGWRYQGLAEQLLPLQRELNRLGAAYSENVQRMAWPRVGIEVSSNVNEAALAGKSGGTFKYATTIPKFINPESITADQFKYMETIVNQMRERIGISDQASGVKVPSNLSSGLAIEKQSVIDDARHRELSQHLESCVQQIAVLLIEAAEECKPTVTLPGRKAQQIKWSDVNLDQDSYWLRPFPMGSLPQTIAGKQQILDTWAASGRISKATQNRLEQIPDIDGYLDLVNAASESIEAALDRIVEDGIYEPPTPFSDLTDQLATAQSRYLFEKAQQDTPQDRLDLLLSYIAATQELIEDATPAPAPNPAPGGFGLQPPIGPAPVKQLYPATANVPIPQPVQ